MATLLCVWDAPPAYIENWRRGAAGERRTARALRALDRSEWHVSHDVSAEHGNRDHVVVGPSGVYLLDTKTRTGLVRVEGDIVVVDQRDDPRASYRLDRVAAGQRAEATRLKADLELAAGRTWVQTVVVIWAEFPQRLVEGHRIVFVHGDELAGWLRQRPATLGEHRTARLPEAVRALGAANESLSQPSRRPADAAPGFQ